MLFLGLISLFTFNAFAQEANFIKTALETKTCSSVPFEMPKTISSNTEAFANYIRVMSLPSGERQRAFSELTNEDKANLFKVKIALQFIKRPNLNRAQKGLILDTLATISADTYDKTNPQKVAQTERNTKILETNALRLFPQNDAYEIFADMNGDKSFETNLLARYEDLLKHGMLMRRRIVNKIPMNERVKIWETQLVFHLATSLLRKEQKVFIIELIPNIKSIIEASLNLPTEEKNKHLIALEANIFNVFTKPEGYSIFMTVGIQHRVADNPVLLRQFELGYLPKNYWNTQIINSQFAEPLKLFINSKRQVPSCTCRWYCDPIGVKCGGNACDATTTGCGPFDTSACTNRCYQENLELEN